MGQSATLYRIGRSDFEKVSNNPGDFDLSVNAKASATFDETFEGLRFVLSKGRSKETEEIIDQIFYPKTHLGKQIDFSDVDFDNIADDFDLVNEAIYYNSPEQLKIIAAFLDSISTRDFKDAFDPEELNDEFIYPEGVWNDDMAPDEPFSRRHLTAEFEKLKLIIEQAGVGGDYMLSYVG